MNRSRRTIMLIIFIVCVAAIVGAYIAIDDIILANVLMVGEAQLRSTALVSINSAMKETISDVDVDEELVSVQYDGAGNITLIQANTIKINEIANKTALTVQRNIDSVGNQNINVALGNLMGGQLFTGKGPKIRIDVEPIGSVSTAYYTEFESAGINQTRHKIYIVVNAYMRMMAGSKMKSVEVSSEMLISETIIVGVVPESFVNVESTDDLLNLLP